MGVKKVTDQATEGDLESRIDAALKLAFPFLPSGALTHQTTFSFNAGHSYITVDGANKKSVNFRADILINHNGIPLAVIELKRPGLSLTEDDNKQGLSYARVQFPSPPLVVVTNGQEFRILETHTGQEWKPADRSSQAVAGLFQNAAKVAERDLKDAIGTLMGTNSQVWIQAVRHASSAAISQLTGRWDQRFLPFVEDFQLPRKATALVRRYVREGHRMIIVSGAPMIGKSSVLREFVGGEDDGYATLFLESDGETSILRSVADLLTQELNWSVTPEEARKWLRDISRTDGPRLLIVVDGIGLSFPQIRNEISDLCSDTFGKSLGVVFELDESLADEALLDSKKSRMSKIGKKAKIVRVDRLDDEEFDRAAEVLAKHQIVFTKGSELSPEYRLPWILRAFVSPFGCRLDSVPEHVMLGFPPVLSLSLFSIIRESLYEKDDLRRVLRGIALAIIQDADKGKRSPELALMAASVFVVRRDSLKIFLDADDLKYLEIGGWIKSRFFDSGEDVYIIRVPELVASEIAHALGKELSEQSAQSGEDAAIWLNEIAGMIPFGDLIAAQAILDHANIKGGLSVSLIGALLNIKPSREEMQSGTEFAMMLPNGMLNCKVTGEGVVFRDNRGVEHPLKMDLKVDPLLGFKDLNSWLILSHLAAVAFEVVEVESDESLGRGETELLLRIGECPFVLRNSTGDHRLDHIACHYLGVDGEIACHDQGIVEVITNSMYVYFARECWDSEWWIDEALKRGKVPLLARISLALQMAAASANSELAKFAEEMLRLKVGPAFNSCCVVMHNHD